MLFNLCNKSEGVFNSAYRMQLLAAVSGKFGSGKNGDFH